MSNTTVVKNIVNLQCQKHCQFANSARHSAGLVAESDAERVQYKLCILINAINLVLCAGAGKEVPNIFESVGLTQFTFGVNIVVVAAVMGPMVDREPVTKSQKKMS